LNEHDLWVAVVELAWSDCFKKSVRTRTKGLKFFREENGMFMWVCDHCSINPIMIREKLKLSLAQHEKGEYEGIHLRKNKRV